MFQTLTEKDNILIETAVHAGCGARIAGHGEMDVFGPYPKRGDP
jgi:hypothetical protein